MTQWAMNQCAQVGLLKMDFLGLTNLTILEAAVAIVEEESGQRPDYLQLPDGDARTFQLLARGETFGVFQLESSGMRRYVQDLKPTQLADLAAMVALYRPGPMEHIPRFIRSKHGREAITYPHPDLSEILDPHLRRDRLPGPGAADRAQVRRLFPGPGRHYAQGHGQEDPGGDAGGARAASSRARRSWATAQTMPTPSSISSSRSRATPSTRPTPSATALSPTRPPT